MRREDHVSGAAADEWGGRRFWFGVRGLWAVSFDTRRAEGTYVVGHSLPHETELAAQDETWECDEEEAEH
jgi:hypothetical protein